ncbi:FCS-Like Zinc finger 8 [Linum grandiflorum]
MELSEDYTCVISRKGTNPKTTHIFDNCVVENYFCLSSENSMNDSRDFLSFCYTCKKSLEQKRDIFIYRFLFRISLQHE